MRPAKTRSSSLRSARSWDAPYRELGEQFEDEEHERFGEHGFRDVVDEVADLEPALGIHDLASFTPAL